MGIMNSSQMEKYVWASVLYYAVVLLGFLTVVLPATIFGFWWGLLAATGYFPLVIFLFMWRRRRHPRSVYQIELAKQRLGG